MKNTTVKEFIGRPFPEKQKLAYRLYKLRKQQVLLESRLIPEYNERKQPNCALGKEYEEAKARAENQRRRVNTVPLWLQFEAQKVELALRERAADKLRTIRGYMVGHSLFKINALVADVKRIVSNDQNQAR